MNNNEEIINKYFQQIVGLKARNVRQGWGSFLFIDFGKDIETQVQTKKGLKTVTRGEWLLWVYMSPWEFLKDDEVIVDSEDSRERIKKVLKEIERKPLTNFEVCSDTFDMCFEFGNEIDLFLYSNNSEEDNEQWTLFTPEKKALTAGPNTTLLIEDAGGN